jgi:cyclic-di-GMP-binding protein
MFDIKGLVNSLFQSNTQEGVFDLKSATIFMEELPESDILQAQIEIVKALKQLNSTPKINMGERFKTIPYLEEKAQPLQNHLLDIYHGRLIEEGTSAHQVLPTILSFWHEMATGYLGCIKQVNQKKFTLIQEKTIELFTLRAMELYAIQAQYSYMRHLEIDHQIWRNLNRLYHFAEQSNFANKPLNSENASIQRCYIQALMLSLSNPEKLQSAQIELLAIWLQKWSAEIKLETVLQTQQHLFAINLTGTSAPKRIRRDMVGENWRYWSAAPITEQIQNLITQIKQGETPNSLGLPAETASPIHLEQLQTLSSLWSRDAETPVRKHPRQNNSKSIQVIIGIQHIVPYMSQQGKTSNNSNNHISTEKWELGDESSSGFGLNYHSDTQLEIGELLGLANLSHYPFTIGIVRRFNRSHKGFVSVGVETLTQSPVMVELTPLIGENSFQCIYAPEGPSSSPARFLIIPNEAYSENREYKFTAQAKSYRIRLSPALEHTPSFVLAKFTVLEKL